MDKDLDLSTADRGNEVVPPVVDEAAAQAASAAAVAAGTEADVATAAAATQVETDAAVVVAAATAAGDKPREADGKFAKKTGEAPMVPKSRFDEQVGKERTAREAAERQTAELTAQLRAKGETLNIDKAIADVRAIRREQEAALFAGDKEKSAALADKADDMNRDIGEAKAVIKARAAQQETEASTEAERVNTAISQLETDHPEFQEGHELFNEKLVNFTLAEQNRLITEKRMSPSKALLQAAKDTMELFGAKAAPAEAAEPAPKNLSAAATGSDRLAAQVAKNLTTAKAQPGSMKELGMDSDKAGTNQVANEDAAKMTQEEFAALPEATKAKMRGDVV